MLFTSYEFVVFFFIVVALYYAIRRDYYQRIVLLLAGFVFYAFNFPWLLILLLSSILFNSYISYGIVYFEQGTRKFWVTLGVVLNLGILVFFKYSPLIGNSFLPANWDLTTFLLAIPLPIGISFYTFEGISLVVDMYRSKSETDQKKVVSKNFASHTINTALLQSFFPHLISGPIVRASDFIPQVKAKLLKDIEWNEAVKKIILGFFLKMVVADNLSEYTKVISFPAFLEVSSVNLVMLIIAYSFQIFADFQGYSLIAIGLGLVFGYRLTENFNFPYISASFSEFWTRWHISLSSWLRDYLYISLGGNRVSKVRTYVNLFIVMFLGGLWHGAAWSYAIWGTVHGGMLAIERLLADLNLKTPRFLLGFKWLLVFLLVSYAWLFFKLPDITHAWVYTKAIYQNRGIFPDYREILLILLYGLPVMLYHLAYVTKFRQTRTFAVLEPAFYGLLLFFITTENGAGGAFIYFQF